MVSTYCLFVTPYSLAPLLIHEPLKSDSVHARMASWAGLIYEG